MRARLFGLVACWLGFTFVAAVDCAGGPCNLIVEYSSTRRGRVCKTSVDCFFPHPVLRINCGGLEESRV